LPACPQHLVGLVQVLLPRNPLPALDLVDKVLPVPDRHREVGDLSFYKSDLSEEIRDEGRAEGRAEGEARRAAQDVLDILEVRGIVIPEAVRERITGCGDPEVLRHWLRRAVTAPTAEDVFTDE
jgi:hypothetical protein